MNSALAKQLPSMTATPIPKVWRIPSRSRFEDLGGEIVAFTAVNVGDTDMRPVLTAVAAAGPPEFLYFPVFTAECAFLAKQAKEVAGLEDTVYFRGGWLYLCRSSRGHWGSGRGDVLLRPGHLLWRLTL